MFSATLKFAADSGKSNEKKIQTMERSTDLENLTRQLYEAVSRSDITFVQQQFRPGEGCVVIGTAPDEWWTDSRGAVNAMREQMKAVGNALRLVPGEVKAYQHGDVGWVADRPKFLLGDTEVPCRHTAVFIREDGRWRIVQYHFSIGIANEDAFGDSAGKLSKAR